MMDTYRVRHAIRDVGAALGMPPGEIDTIAKAFPHIRARDARVALRELPELRASGLDRRPARPAVPAGRAARRAAPARRPAPVRGAALRRHPARPHPGRGQLRRLPDEPVRQGRRRGPRPAQARRARHPDAVGDGPRGRRDQAASTGSRSTSTTRRRCRSTTRRPSTLISAAKHPRRLPDRVAGPARAGRQVRASETFEDIITDISLFRPGPVKSDMVTPFLEARQGWNDADLPPRRPAPDPRARPRAWWSSTSR